MDIIEKNKKNWEDTLIKLFPSGIPDSCEWTKVEEIISVLNTIGSISNTNYIFPPIGGVTEIKSSKLSHERGCIEIYTGIANILKPKRLLFESFNDAMWNYFRIETSAIPASGVYKNNDGSFEDLVEIEPGRYIKLDYCVFNEYEGEEFPDTARTIIRFFEGTFLIFAQSSYFNNVHKKYYPRFNKMNAVEFKSFIEGINQRH